MNMAEAHKKYFETWIAGINDETLFWDRLFASKGSCGGDRKVFEYRINPSCPFQLHDELECIDDKILDVGSGPYSRLGFCVDDKKLDITLVDPLACVYREIGKKYNISFPIQVQTGLVEILHFLFPKGSYDFVHMSNALDHCFDPIVGIKELLFVTKIGGKLVLRHSDNEAERARYSGFHQWNLTVNDGEFIIWRKDQKIIVNEIIEHYAEVEIAEESEETLFEDKWKYNKVVIRKKKDIPLDGFYSTQVLTGIIERLVSQNAAFLFDEDKRDS